MHAFNVFILTMCVGGCSFIEFLHIIEGEKKTFVLKVFLTKNRQK